MYTHTHICIYIVTSGASNSSSRLHTRKCRAPVKSMFIYTYIPTYLHTYIPTYLHTYIPTYLHTYIPTYLHTYLPTYLPYIHTYIHTYMHTYIRTYVRTYVHTYICVYIYIYSIIKKSCSRRDGAAPADWARGAGWKSGWKSWPTNGTCTWDANK